jgi:nitroreductase
VTETLVLSPDELLTTTRAVRRRLDLDRPVDLAVIKECLTIALQAPSGSNAQRWHWLVVTDAEQRGRIGALYGRACRSYLESASAAGKLFPDDPERAAVQRRIGRSVEYLADRMGLVPVLVIPCLTVSGGELPAGNQAGLWASLLPAAWSYMLAARARGLGTVWTTLHLNHEREIAEILGLPPDVRQAALIPTAYAIGTDFKPAARQPIENVLHVDRW